MPSEMTQKDAYEYGKNNGLGIGEENRLDYTDFDTYFSECLETEMDHFRQYSPFEFYAKEFNDPERVVYYTRTDSQGRTQNHERIVPQDPDRMWGEYEKGVEVGLRQAWREK
jgi:hypothetical protein